MLPPPIVVSSEDDPDARAISLDVESGQYLVTLRPGWRLERVTPSGAENVEATLLSDATTWVYVWPRSSTYAEYEFGLGDRAIWMNGQLNIQIRVLEEPFTTAGTGGAGGWTGTAGTPGMGGANAGGAFAQ